MNSLSLEVAPNEPIDSVELVVVINQSAVNKVSATEGTVAEIGKAQQEQARLVFEGGLIDNETYLTVKADLEAIQAENRDRVLGREDFKILNGDFSGVYLPDQNQIGMNPSHFDGSISVAASKNTSQHEMQHESDLAGVNVSAKVDQPVMETFGVDALDEQYDKYEMVKIDGRAVLEERAVEAQFDRATSADYQENFVDPVQKVEAVAKSEGEDIESAALAAAQGNTDEYRNQMMSVFVKKALAEDPTRANEMLEQAEAVGATNLVEVVQKETRERYEHGPELTPQALVA